MWPGEGHKLKRSNTTNVGVLTSSDFFPSPCTLEVSEVVPEIPTLLLQLYELCMVIMSTLCLQFVLLPSTGQKN